MTIKELYELAKEQAKEDYEVEMCFVDEKQVYIEPTYDYEFDNEEKKILLL